MNDHLTLLPFHLTLLPLRLVSESNQRLHWAAQHRHVQMQRRFAYAWLRQWMPTPPPLPLTITLTRVAPRALDSHDNLCASAKHVVDGISDWLAGQYGAGQDRQLGLTWAYAQRRGQPREYAVEIVITTQTEGDDLCAEPFS